MDISTETYIKFEKLINKEAGIINSFKILPNSRFIPGELVQTSSFGNNLYPVGCYLNEISSGGIGFSFQKSMYSTIGEFFERYCSGIIQRKENYVFGSYNELKKEYDLEDYDSFNLFNKDQYLEKGMIFQKINGDTPIFWIKGENLMDKTEIYCPASFVHSFNFDKNIRLPGTTTGLAAGKEKTDVIKGAILECIERHAFSIFWYQQNEIDIIKYSSKLILNTFPNNKKLKTLFNNKKVKLTVFDLTHLSYTYTYLCIMYFKINGITYFSTGCSSNFDREVAIEKATLESYKCSEELETILEENESIEPINIENLGKHIRNFKDHYWLYNKCPNLRKGIRVFRESANDINFKDEIFEYENNNNEFDLNFIKKFTSKIHYFDLTIPSVKDLGFNVGRIIMPELNLLSGMAEAPFLKYFKNDENLFTKLPHFFP